MSQTKSGKGKTYDVAVLGGLNWDYTVKGSHLPQPGQVLKGGTFFEGPGGKGGNQAVAAARMGARVVFLGCLGVDKCGEDLIQRLENENVDVRYLKRDPGVTSGVAVIMVDEVGEKQILTVPGANDQVTVDGVRAVADVIAKSKVLMTQFEVPLSALVRALEVARLNSTKIVLDPSPPISDLDPELLSEILADIDLIKPNATEAKALTKIQVVDKATAKSAAKKIMEMGARAVAIQAGAEGNLVMRRGESFFLPRIPVPAIDATGAGDAFLGAAAAIIAEGGSFQDMAIYGHAAAALQTQGLGAQDPLPSREKLDAFLSRISVHRESA